MANLHIEHIKAVIPQAKGRVERLWRTFQDQLVIELRLLGVRTLEEANAALPKLVEKHNRQFAVKPRESESAYLPLDHTVQLDHVFTRREYRQLGSGNTISYNGTIYTLAKPSTLRLMAKMTVEVRETLDGEVLLWIQRQALMLKATERPVRAEKSATQKAGSAQPRKPASDHPWRKPAVTQTRNKRTTTERTFQEAAYSQHNRYAEAPVFCK